MLIEYITNVLTLIFIVSIPIYFLYPAIAFLFWGYSLQQHWKKLLLFAVIEAFYIDWFIFILPLPLYFLNSTISYILLFFIIFNHLKVLTRIKIAIFSFFILISIDMLTGMVVSQFVSRESLLSNPALLILGAWPVHILLIVIIYLMQKYKWSPGVEITKYIRGLKSKKISYLLVFLFFQFVVLTLSIGILFESNKSFQFIDYMLYIALALSCAIIVITLRVISQTKDDAVRMTQQIYIEDVNRMFTTIRGQRHDFLNHAQVISSFVQQGKMKELERYTSELIGEITEINGYIQIGHPALSALIQSKTIISLDKKIDFRYQCKGLESLTLGVKSIDIVKIAGNLIDNAFDEVSNLQEENRWIELECWTENSSLFLVVRNPGRCLSKEERSLIFDSGYSTKENNHHIGIGLSIVKERVEHYKGAIAVESYPSIGTLFKVEIPIG